MSGLKTKELSEEDNKRHKRRQGLLQAGAVLQDRYQIVDTLGVGGFSSVYKARDMHFPAVTRLCAVKEMVHLNRDPKVREMATASFEREASILATLDHAAVPDVYDFFTESDRSYLVLEYIHGQDLEALLNEQQTFFPVENVIDWTIQLCEVLEYLHKHEPSPVVFRDLKPSNVMLDRHGKIRLIDFNIAKVFQTGLKGTMIGTEGYSPPEQYRGEASPAGDIYALGATFHHLLTRQDPRTEPPFSFDERPIRSANPEVPREFEAILQRCLAYNVSDRFQNVAELRQALIEIAPGTQSLTPSNDGTASPVMTGTTPNHLQTPTTEHAQSRPGQRIKPLWKFRCEDEIRSSAAIDDEIIYIGTYDNNLYALTAENGEFIWKYPTSDGIATTPYLFRDSIFICSADGYLYSVQRGSGRLNWRFETGGPIYSSPKAEFEHVFFGSDDGYFYAVSASNGRKVWQTNAHGTVRSTPCVGDDKIYFGTEGGYVFCLDLSGKVKWQFQAKRSITSSPALAEDMVFVGSMDSTVYGIDANSGWALWRFRTRRPVVSSPAVASETVLIGSSDGNLYSLDTYSGRQTWLFETEGQINSSPTVSGNSVYFGSTDGNVYCLDLKRGKLRWKYQTNGVIVGSPLVTGGRVYIGSCDHHIYALPA
ncbi:MAG: serine/threonine-protein kinase [Chloroflexota bacterium]|jgi:serine/threonine protein kinase